MLQFSFPRRGGKKNGKTRPNDGEVERPADRVNFTFAREFYFDPAAFPTTALRRDPCLHKEVPRCTLPPYRQFSPGSLPYFAVTAHPGSSPRHSTARAIGFSCSTPLRCPRNPNFAFFTRPGQVECPVKSISLVIRQKRNLLSLRYPAANADSLLSFFFFLRSKSERKERGGGETKPFLPPIIVIVTIFIALKKRGWRNETVKRRGKKLRQSWFTSMSVYTREFHSNFRHYGETCLSPG